MTEQQYHRFVDLIENQIPFNKLMGIRVERLERGRCVLNIPFREDLLGDARRGAIHGGVLSTLADTCGGFAVWTMCGISDRIATIDLRVDYLKPALGVSLVADSTVRLLGNRVGNAHTVIHPEGRPEHILVEGRGVYNVRRSDS